MEAHRSMVTNSQVKLPTSPAINNLSIPFISKRMFPLVHTFTEWITLQKSYHETASVSVPHLISCASHSATKATSLKYGERQSPSGKSSFSQWKGTALVPSPLWLLPFFIHAIMHIHFKRIFAIHYPGFPCVLCNEVFWLFHSLLSPEMEVQEQFSRVTRALPACMLSRFSRIQLFETLWATACQAPLSTKFSRQEHWSELSCPPPRDLPHPGTEVSHTAGGFFSIWATREAQLSLWATTTEPALSSPGAATTEIHVPRSLSSPRETSAIRSRHTCN